MWNERTADRGAPTREDAFGSACSSTGTYVEQCKKGQQLSTLSSCGRVCDVTCVGPGPTTVSD